MSISSGTPNPPQSKADGAGASPAHPHRGGLRIRATRLPSDGSRIRLAERRTESLPQTTKCGGDGGVAEVGVDPRSPSRHVLGRVAPLARGRSHGGLLRAPLLAQGRLLPSHLLRRVPPNGLLSSGFPRCRFLHRPIFPTRLRSAPSLNPSQVRCAKRASLSHPRRSVRLVGPGATGSGGQAPPRHEPARRAKLTRDPSKRCFSARSSSGSSGSRARGLVGGRTRPPAGPRAIPRLRRSAARRLPG